MHNRRYKSRMLPYETSYETCLSCHSQKKYAKPVGIVIISPMDANHTTALQIDKAVFVSKGIKRDLCDFISCFFLSPSNSLDVDTCFRNSTLCKYRSQLGVD